MVLSDSLHLFVLFYSRIDSITPVRERKLESSSPSPSQTHNERLRFRDGSDLVTSTDDSGD